MGYRFIYRLGERYGHGFFTGTFRFLDSNGARSLSDETDKGRTCSGKTELGFYPKFRMEARRRQAQSHSNRTGITGENRSKRAQDAVWHEVL